MKVVYYDPIYFLFMFPAIIISLLAQLNVQTAFMKYSRISSFSRDRKSVV